MRGVKAAALDSSQSRESVLHTYDLLRRDELKLLWVSSTPFGIIADYYSYCAPERLNNEGFVETIKHTRIRLVAVDEAHCISEWGQAFRPDYLKGLILFSGSLPHADWCRSRSICEGD